MPLLLAACACHAQRRDGTYKPASAAPVPWSINEHQTLIWGGKPYLPFGVRIDGTADAVTKAKAAGINDVIVDLPANGAGWDPVIEALNKANMRFLIRIASLAPMAHGFAVEPQGYRVTGITEQQEVKLQIPGATSAYVVLATRNDATVITKERVPIVDGQFDYTAKPGPALEHVLLVYPEMAGIEQTDYWENLDAERDELLSTLQRHPLGPGLRGIVDPMGRGLAIDSDEPTFVPTSPFFRMEFAAFLLQKYKNVEALIKNWSLGSSSLLQQDVNKNWLVKFSDLAKLIPLWSTSRGIGAMLDPETNTTYPCDNKTSKIWTDISEVISAAENRRFSRLVPAIRSVVDVPVIQEWLGWASPYETTLPALDGVGMRAAGTTESSLAASGGPAASTILRWQSHGWLVATDLDLGAAPDAATKLPGTLDELTSMGAKGVFVRTDSPALVKQMASEATRRSADTDLSNTSPIPVFFPENACNPAEPQRLPNGHWWLPTPLPGNRIDLGAKFFAYRSGLNDGTVVLWTHEPGRYRLSMVNPKSARFQTLDGSDCQPKYNKSFVDVTLTQFPLIITGTYEIPIPDPVFLETVARFKYMMEIADKGHLGTEAMQMYFTNAYAGFERNPGGSYSDMRIQYWRLADLVGSYTWIEAERTPDTNFSEVVTDPGCSGGQALALKTMVPPGPGGYYAEYTVPVRNRDDQELWIAAKVPPERRGDLTVVIGGERMKLIGEPLSPYGTGYGWYKLGLTRLAGEKTKIRVQVDTCGNDEIAIDSILLTPRAFRPNGVVPPDPMDFPVAEAKPGKPSKRRGSGGS